MYRIVYPVQHVQNQLQHSLWVCELALLTEFKLILIDMTEDIAKEDIRTSFLDSVATSTYESQITQLDLLHPLSLTQELDSVILVGTTKTLQNFHKKNDTYHTLPSITLPEVIEFPLSKQNSLLGRMKRSKTFYTIFQQADKVKLPQELFLNLGRDKDLFNQLISFFRQSNIS